VVQKLLVRDNQTGRRADTYERQHGYLISLTCIFIEKQPYILLHYIALHNIALYYIALHYISLHYIALYYIALYYIALYYIIL
jgi:hypothetical protein